MQRYAEENRHNAQIPKQIWLQKAEKEAVLDYHKIHPDEGYRRLAYMMLDENIAAISPSSAYQRLPGAQSRRKAAKMGKNFLKKGDRLQATIQSTPTLAYRHHLHQHLRDLLLPVQRAGRL